MGCAAGTEPPPSPAPPDPVAAEHPRFFDTYALGEKLGEGFFADVHAVCSVAKDGSEDTAVKILRLVDAGGSGIKVGKTEAQLQRAYEEYRVWSSLGAHPNVVQLRGFCVERSPAELGNGGCRGAAYLLMERCGETLAQHLNLFCPQHGGLSFPDSTLRKVFRGMLAGVDHVHAHGVVHRDVKVDNFLMSSGRAAEVKLCDFGTAVELPRCGSLRCRAAGGTVPYKAPEMLCERTYGLPADVWACGVCVYNVVFDDLPYKPTSYTVASSGASRLEAFKDAIRSGQPPSFAPRHLRAPPPALAAALARALLTRDARLRPTAAAALRLEFFHQISGEASGEVCHPLDPDSPAKDVDDSPESTDAGDSASKCNSHGEERSSSREAVF